MYLSTQGITGAENRRKWSQKGYRLPEYDRERVTALTSNIFRAFQANTVQNLLNDGVLDRGLIVVEGYDYEIIDKIYRPHDDLNILATLKSDGSIEKTVIGSIVESHILDTDNECEYRRLVEIFTKVIRLPTQRGNFSRRWKRTFSQGQRKRQAIWEK